MPEKKELPFYDPDENDTMSKAERVGMYQAWAKYGENLRNGA
ncbi:hypothetical protein [Halalkalirubrum salinum]|nr:hypothetical protein [Halalkalirubrum salinum]